MARRKPQGHYCKICGERKSNESFSGKGHAAHICKACSTLSPQQQAEQMTLNRLAEMPMRYLSNAEVKWLKSRTSDQRPAVRELARFDIEINGPEPVTWRVYVEYSNGEIQDTESISGISDRLNELLFSLSEFFE